MNNSYAEGLLFTDYLSIIGSSVPTDNNELIALYEVWRDEYIDYCIENGYLCKQLSMDRM